MSLILHDQDRAVEVFKEHRETGILPKNFIVPENLLLIGCHNFIENSFFETQMKEYKCKDYKCMRLAIHPWSNTLRLRPYIKHLKSEKCKSKEYVIFLDTDDAFIHESPDKILKTFLDDFDCDLLFNATRWPRGYANTPASQFNKKWAEQKHKGWYLNAGAYIGKKDFIIDVFEEVLKYVTDEDLPAKKWYWYESNSSKITKKMEKSFPLGCGSDQAILRHIEKLFYPRLLIDTERKIFVREGTKLNYENERNIFIDCGGHRGQSIRKFKKQKVYFLNEFEIYSFEPNFKLIENYASQNTSDKIMPQAVWVEDKEMNFYLDENDFDGSSLLKEKKHPGGWRENNLEHPMKVGAIDFSSWVLRNFSINDYIILKMDIEGAEYEVLSKMIKDGSINYINELYIEWHHEKVNISKEIHDALIKKIKSTNIIMHGEFLKGAEHLEYK